MRKTEKRLLLDLQVIKKATPAKTQTGEGFAPQRRQDDSQLAALLYMLGALTRDQFAAIVAQT